MVCAVDLGQDQRMIASLRIPALLSATLTLASCGAGALGLPEAPADAGSETGEAGEPGEPGEQEGGGDGDALAACIDEGGLARAFAVADGEAELVHVFEADGAELSLPAGLPPDIEAPATVGVSVSATHLAVGTSYSIYASLPEVDEGTRLRVYARDSFALAWSRDFDDYRLGPTYVDDEGRVAATVGWSSPSRPAGVIVSADGLTELEHFAPAGPIGPSGWLPGRIYDDADEPSGTGFYRPDSAELVEVSVGATPSGWHAWGEIIEYIDNAAELPRLVRAGPEAETVIELEPYAGVDALVFTMAVAGDYRLLAAHVGDVSEDAPLLVRADTASDELLTIDPELPPGFEPFDCYSQSAALDGRGRILFELRDADSAQIHAWDPQTATWTPVGAPMTLIDDVGVVRSFGRVVQIQAMGVGQTYCPSSLWSEAPPPTALAGNSVQLARVEPPLSEVINGAGYSAMVSVDPAERCAGWSTAEGVQLLDLDDGETLDLPVSGSLVWL